MGAKTRDITRRGAIAACLAAGLALAWAILDRGRAASTLPAYGGRPVGGDATGQAWDDLLAPYPDAVGWVRVAGTRVEQPLMQASDDEPERWLHHAPDGSADPEGSVFLDSRCSTSAAHALAYGHHVGDTGRMLSDLHRAYEQATFDLVGELTLYVRETCEVRTLAPAFAMSVDESFADIQRFGFPDGQSLREWLSSLLARASAASGAADALVASATSAVTLVTCSSERAGQRSRTLLTFCEGGGA